MCYMLDFTMYCMILDTLRLFHFQVDTFQQPEGQRGEIGEGGQGADPTWIALYVLIIGKN